MWQERSVPGTDARATMTALVGVAAFKGMETGRSSSGSRLAAGCLEPRDGTRNLRRGRCGRRRVRLRRRRGAHSRRLARPQQQGPDVRGVRRRRDLRGNRGHREQHPHRRRRGGGPRAAAAHRWLRVPRTRSTATPCWGPISVALLAGRHAPDVGFCSATRRSESLEVRLARQVLYLARTDGRNTAQGRQLGGRLRQGDLADLLGATTRSIITILNAWRADGLVVVRPRAGAAHDLPGGRYAAAGRCRRRADAGAPTSPARRLRSPAGQRPPTPLARRDTSRRWYSQARRDAARGYGHRTAPSSSRPPRSGWRDRLSSTLASSCASGPAWHPRCCRRAPRSSTRPRQVSIDPMNTIVDR